MNRTVSAEKQEWRRRQRALCRGRCPEERAALAASLGLHLGRWLEAVRPTVVLAFRPLDDEPSLPDLPERIRAGGHRDARYLASPDQLAPIVAGIAQPGDFVILLGAGNITQWAAALPRELEAFSGKS